MVRPSNGKRCGHPLYGAWLQMINRCHNPNNYCYSRYGGVGIQVCARWRNEFLDFLSDVGERPDGMTLDRINPTGDYEPENCRWADAKTQRRNQSAFAKERGRRISSDKAKARWALDRKKRTKCRTGRHEWTDDNVYRHPKGWLMCRACRSEAHRRRQDAARSLEIERH